MYYRTTGIITTAILTAILFASSAFAQYVPVGRVVSVAGDIVTIKGGADLGFQVGDVLVDQREGVKVAILKVEKVAATSSEAKIVNSDFGYNIEHGDELAYELLREGRSRTVSVYTADEYWEYPNDYIPSFVELFQEKVPPMPRSDLDYEIERQKRVLEQQPKSREAMIRLADAYFRKDWFELAIYWYQRAIQEQSRAVDTDKMIYQVVRCYGALGRPDKQKLYMDYLRVNFPSSVFTTFETQLDIIEPTVQMLPEWQRHPPKRVHMRKGGMRSLEKGGMNLLGQTTYGPVHGEPGKIDSSSTKATPVSSSKKDAAKDAKKDAAAKDKKAAKTDCAASITGISGAAEVKLSGGAWQNATMNQCLNPGDKVRTTDEGAAIVTYGKGDTAADVTVNAKTTITIGPRQ